VRREDVEESNSNKSTKMKGSNITCIYFINGGLDNRELGFGKT